MKSNEAANCKYIKQIKVTDAQMNLLDCFGGSLLLLLLIKNHLHTLLKQSLQTSDCLLQNVVEFRLIQINLQLKPNPAGSCLSCKGSLPVSLTLSSKE